MAESESERDGATDALTAIKRLIRERDRARGKNEQFLKVLKFDVKLRPVGRDFVRTARRELGMRPTDIAELLSTSVSALTAYK